MSIDFENILNLANEADRRINQRGFAGIKPSEALNTAEEKIQQWKSDWSQNSTNGLDKPRETETNNARRLKNSLKPILSDINQLKSNLVNTISESFDVDPNLFTENEILAAGAILTIDKYPPDQPNSDIKNIFSDVSESLRKNGKVQLLMFSCPEIDAGLLTTPYPEMFIKTTAGINTGTADPRPINRLTEVLSALDIPSELVIVVGELDEETYIFPIIGDFGIDKQTLGQKRSEYLNNFKGQALGVYPKTQVNTIGWSSLYSQRCLSSNLPSIEFLNEEAERMSSFFQPGKYYGGLPIPTTEQLLKMAELKIYAYADQGNTLKQMFPFAIGIQNEIPTKLRTLMLNAELLAQRKRTISMIYPFNTKDSIY